jgi:hypothetical protein
MTSHRCGRTPGLEARLLTLQPPLDAKAVAFRLCREQWGQLRVLCEAHLELEQFGPADDARRWAK